MAISPHVYAELEKGALLRHDAKFSKHVPYTRFLDNGVIATRDGDLAIVFELDGLPHELADDAALHTARAAIARAMLQLGDGYNLVYAHSIRMKRDTADLMKPVEGEDFAAAVDARYRDQLADQTMYEMRHFITVVRRPVVVTTGFWRGALASLASMYMANSYRKQDAENEIAENRRRAIQKLEGASSVLTMDLARFGIRRLGGSAEDRRVILSYLSMLSSGIWRDAPAVKDYLAHAVGTGRIIFGGEAFRITGPAPADSRVGAIMAIQDYDEQTHAGMFDDLAAEKIEYIVTHSFFPLDRIDSVREARDRKKAMLDSMDDAESVMDALNDAVDDITASRIILGKHHMTISVFADTDSELVDALAQVNSALGATGLKMRREDLGMEAAWWAQLPGNVGYQARSEHRLISNENFADFCPFHTYPSGEQRRLPWGLPITVFPTYSDTAFHFSFHAPGDVSNGNTLIFGPPDSGKTALAGFLLSQSRRLDRPPRVIYFDKDRGAESMIRALGGDYIRLGPEHGSAFNPFALIEDEAGAEWLAEFVERLADVKLTPEQTRRLFDAARRNAETDNPSLKTFGNFLSLLRSVDDEGGVSLTDHLAEWTGQGARAWLFDNARDTFTISDRAFGIDMTSLLKAPKTRSAALDYLFFRLERLLEDGYPTIIFLDEGWKLLRDDRFEERILDWMKTVRKLNCILVFATQEPADAAKSNISEALIQSAETSIFFANPSADEASYMGALRVSRTEYEAIATLPPERRAMLIKQSRGSVLVKARLDNTDALKVFSGKAESVRLMELMRAEHGDDWLKHYLEKDAA